MARFNTKYGVWNSGRRSETRKQMSLANAAIEPIGSTRTLFRLRGAIPSGCVRRGLLCRIAAQPAGHTSLHRNRGSRSPHARLVGNPLTHSSSATTSSRQQARTIWLCQAEEEHWQTTRQRRNRIMSRGGVQGFQKDRLSQILAARRLTQVQLASMVDVSPATVSKWRAGTQAPERDALERLAGVVNVTPEWLARAPGAKLSLPLFRSNASAHVAARAMLEARLEWAPGRGGCPDGVR